MLIRDLSAPVTAAKVDWLPGDAPNGALWMGFTPLGNTPAAISQCQSAIFRQAKNGYVLEYVTLTFGTPNPGFENDPRLLREREEHKSLAGRLVAIHKLHPVAEGAASILGPEEYDYLQQVWAKEDRHYRWAVAFRIIETFEIVGLPRADDVFTEDSLKRWRNHSSGTLRPLRDAERDALANLELNRRIVDIDWKIIDDDLARASLSDIPNSIAANLDRDFTESAMEGLTEEQKVKIRKRNAYLAYRFVRDRQARGLLRCDDCSFDPSQRTVDTNVSPRSLLDVHHKDPLHHGPRNTTLSDFALLCPTCHRWTHALIRSRLKKG